MSGDDDTNPGAIDEKLADVLEKNEGRRPAHFQFKIREKSYVATVTTQGVWVRERGKRSFRFGDWEEVFGATTPVTERP